MILSLSACAVLFKMVDWVDFAHRLKSANGYWLFAVFLNMNLDRFLMTYKWRMLIKGLGVPIKFRSALKAYYVGTFWSNFFPASVGADVVRISWCLGEGQNGSKIVSSVFIERLLGILALGIVAMGSLILAIFSYKLKLHSIFGIVIIAFAGSIIIILAIFNHGIHSFLKNIISYLPKRLRKAIDQFMVSILEFKEKPRLLIYFLILSIIEQAFPIISLLLLSKAFSIDLPFVWALIGVPLILIIVRMPISVSGLGVKEGFYALVFSLASIQVSDSLIMALSDRVLVMLTTVPGVFWSITGPNRRLDFPVELQNSDISKITKDHGPEPLV